MSAIRKPGRYRVGISSKELKPPKELPPIGTRVYVKALDYQIDMDEIHNRGYKHKRRFGEVIGHPNEYYALVRMDAGYMEGFCAEDMHVVRHERKGGAQ